MNSIIRRNWKTGLILLAAAILFLTRESNALAIDIKLTVKGPGRVHLAPIAETAKERDVAAPNLKTCTEKDSPCMLQLPVPMKIVLTTEVDNVKLQKFLGWTNLGCRPSGPCSLWADSDLEFSGQFDTVNHELQVSKIGLGSGSIESRDGQIFCGDRCSHQYASGSEVVLSLSRDSLSAGILEWRTGSDECLGSKPDCHLQMDKDYNVVARLDAAQKKETAFLDLFGVGIGITYSASKHHARVEDVVVDDEGYVRVGYEARSTTRLLLNYNAFRFPSSTSDYFGLFASAVSGFGSGRQGAEVLEGAGGGVVWAFVPSNPGRLSLNVGLGFLVEPKVTVLREGVKNGERNDNGSAKLTKEVSVLSTLLMISFGG